MIDYLCISGTQEGRVIEYVDHLHEHFVDPVVIRRGRYIPPMRPGYSIEMKRASMEEYAFPDGPVWKEELKMKKS
jgi:L-fuconate dehydratase